MAPGHRRVQPFKATATAWHAPGRTAIIRIPAPAAPWDAHCGFSTVAQGTVAAGADFCSLGVSPALQGQLAAGGLQQPLPVQAAAVPLILSGHDVAIKSCTGSGKTLAYVLPVMQLALQRRAEAEAAAAAAAATASALATADGAPAAAAVVASARARATALKQAARGVQAVIVAPSRELCIQIQRAAQELLPPSSPRQLVQQVIGGANPKRQAAALSGGEAGVWPAVVVGSPGRLAALVGAGPRGGLAVWGCQILVLDEVDTLLAHDDFRRHVDLIASHVGRRVAVSKPEPSSSGRSSSGSNGTYSSSSGSGGGRQTVLVSASLDPQRLDAYNQWRAQPAAATAGANSATADEGDGKSCSRGRRLELVALGSRAALPEQYLRRQLLKAQGVDAGTALTSDAGSAAMSTTSASAGAAEAPAVPDAAEQPAGSSRPQPGNTTANAHATATAAIINSPNLIATSSTTLDSTSSSTSTPAYSTTWGSNPSHRLADVLPPHLAHVYVLSPPEHRTDRARRLIHALGAERALLFVGRGNQAAVTKYKLEARNMQVSLLHGQLSRLERSNIVAAFRAGTFRALVATDLAARGLDLPDCDAVVNLGPPPDALSYAHRAGRAGRAGAPGVVASVVSRNELKALEAVAARLGVTLQAISVAHGSVAPQDQDGVEGTRLGPPAMHT